MNPKICSVEGCERESRARGWCGLHYDRWRNHGDPLVAGVDYLVKAWLKRSLPRRICVVDGCEHDAPYKAEGGLCHVHYERWWRNGDLEYRRSPGRSVCRLEGCSQPVNSGGLCGIHSKRLKRHSDPLLVQRPPSDGPTALAAKLGISRQRAHQLLNPQAFKAQQTLGVALKRGAVQKAEACERCGSRQTDLEGHHADYAKPLAVRWLCPKCHSIEHPHPPRLQLVREGELSDAGVAVQR